MVSKTSLHARIRLMEKVVAGAGLWCISAFFPEHAALHLANTFQLQLVISMMGLKRGSQESWLVHRKKAYRAARNMLWQGGHRRWSTIWCERHWSYLGHLARGLLQHPNSAATVPCSYRSLEWWNKEKQKTESGRVKHAHQYFARLMNAERLLDSAAGGPWRVLAQNREQWRGHLPQWIQASDVEWASGRQLALN